MKCAVCGVSRDAFADEASWHAHLSYCLAEAHRARLAASAAPQTTQPPSARIAALLYCMKERARAKTRYWADVEASRAYYRAQSRGPGVAGIPRVTEHATVRIVNGIGMNLSCAALSITRITANERSHAANSTPLITANTRPLDTPSMKRLIVTNDVRTGVRGSPRILTRCVRATRRIMPPIATRFLRAGRGMRSPEQRARRIWHVSVSATANGTPPRKRDGASSKRRSNHER
jgi:hypothetical protein